MIDGNEILDLMYKPMYDEKVLNVMEQLGMEVPLLDEKYELEERVVSESSDEQIIFEFEEMDGYSKDGEPNLTLINFQESKLLSLPFDLEYDDSYETCCRKLNKKSDFKSKNRNTIRLWIIMINNVETTISINFDSSFSKIKFLLGLKYEEKESHIPNED